MTRLYFKPHCALIRKVFDLLFESWMCYFKCECSQIDFINHFFWLCNLIWLPPAEPGRALFVRFASLSVSFSAIVNLPSMQCKWRNVINLGTKFLPAAFPFHFILTYMSWAEILVGNHLACFFQKTNFFWKIFFWLKLM